MFKKVLSRSMKPSLFGFFLLGKITVSKSQLSWIIEVSCYPSVCSHCFLFKNAFSF